MLTNVYLLKVVLTYVNIINVQVFNMYEVVNISMLICLSMLCQRLVPLTSMSKKFYFIMVQHHDIFSLPIRGAHRLSRPKLNNLIRLLQFEKSQLIQKVLQA